MNAQIQTLKADIKADLRTIAETFSALHRYNISDQAGWHAELLRHMALDIEGIRPRVISDSAYDALDELRRFRHLFRSAYRVRLDRERLDLVRKKAEVLERIYRDEMEAFLVFLDSLSA